MALRPPHSPVSSAPPEPAHIPQSAPLLAASNVEPAARQQHRLRGPRQRRLAPRPADADHSDDTARQLVVQRRSVPPLLDPKSPPDWAPWASKLTAVQDFYLNNIPDFSGIDMCNTKLLTCNLKELMKINAAVLTIFVLYGETWGSASGLHVTMDIIYQLKSYLYQVIRHRLRTNDGQDDPVLEVIIQIRCLASYEACTSPDPSVALMHIRAIKQLLDTYQGARSNDHFIKSKAAMLWIDRAIKHAHNRPDYIWEPPADAFWNPASPLLLGTLPPPDRLPNRQAWIRLLVSAHMAPGSEILIYVHTVLSNWPAAAANDDDTPLEQTVRTKAVLDAIQERLLAKTPESQSAILIYRDERFELQRVGCEALRRTALVLVNIAQHLLVNRGASVESVRASPHVDHSIQVLLGLNLAGIVCSCPEIVFWCVSIVGPLLADGPVLDSLAGLFQDVMKRLKLKTFKQVLILLAELFAVPFVHDVALHAFWDRAVRSAPGRVLRILRPGEDEVLDAASSEEVEVTESGSQSSD